MIFAKLPQRLSASPAPLPFYLAMEEWLARNFSGEFFFLWQVRPTVIFGRNQIPQAELDLDYCRHEGIEFYRRKSGGGCVFADMNNVMFSYICTSPEVATTFSGFTGRVAAMLREGLGIADAHTTGRNDICIGDRKVSGYAFYHINLPSPSPCSRAIVHGTMLYDADLARMTAALTPGREKLEAKGVESVRSHVTTLREHCAIGLEDFKTMAVSSLCDSVMELTEDDVRAIEQIAAPYFTDKWIFGSRRAATSPRRRVEGAGEFAVTVIPSADDPSVIGEVELHGDYFLLADLEPLLQSLKGIPIDRQAIITHLAANPPERVIRGLGSEALASLIAP